VEKGVAPPNGKNREREKQLCFFFDNEGKDILARKKRRKLRKCTERGEFASKDSPKEGGEKSFR